jgi:hypothetical protein
MPKEQSVPSVIASWRDSSAQHVSLPLARRHNGWPTRCSPACNEQCHIILLLAAQACDLSRITQKRARHRGGYLQRREIGSHKVGLQHAVRKSWTQAGAAHVRTVPPQACILPFWQQAAGRMEPGVTLRLPFASICACRPHQKLFQGGVRAGHLHAPRFCMGCKTPGSKLEGSEISAKTELRA